MSLLTQFYGGGSSDIVSNLEISGGSPGGGITFLEPSATASAPTSWGGVGAGLVSGGAFGRVSIVNSSTSAYWSIYFTSGYQQQGTSGSGAIGYAGCVLTPSTAITAATTPYSCSAGGFTVAVGSKILWQASPTAAVNMSGPELLTFSNVSLACSVGAGSSFSFDFPKLEVLDRFLMTPNSDITFTCPQLTTVTNFRVGGGDSLISLSNASLSYASVSGILASVVNTSASITLTGLTIDLSGGSSAGTSTFTPTDTANLAACLARGVSIILNA